MGNPIFKVEEDGILNIFKGFFVGIVLGIAALKFWAGGELAIFVLFY